MLASRPAAVFVVSMFSAFDPSAMHRHRNAFENGSFILKPLF
jgi:hypothetical protein